jgi:hypothetical protein
MTNKHAVFMTRDGRISLAGLSSAKVRRGHPPLMFVPCRCHLAALHGTNMGPSCMRAAGWHPHWTHLGRAIKN